MTALVRHPELQAREAEQAQALTEIMTTKESRLRMTLTVVLSVNLAIVFGAITLVTLLAGH